MREDFHIFYFYLLVIAKSLTTFPCFPPPLEFVPCFMLHVRLHCFIYLFLTYLRCGAIIKSITVRNFNALFDCTLYINVRDLVPMGKPDLSNGCCRENLGIF